MNTPDTTAPELRRIHRQFALTNLNQAYADCLDQGAMAQWPDFFAADGVYRAQGRENFDRGLPLAAIWCDGRGMLEDRVTVITKIMVYAPRSMRHVVAPPQIVDEQESWLRARASFCVFHTLPHEPTVLLAAGRYEDKITFDQAGAMRFQERNAVYDSVLIPNSLVYPL